MAAVECSSRIAGLTRIKIMPFWWTRKQWQEQFPQEVTSMCYANMEVIKADYQADDALLPNMERSKETRASIKGQTQALFSRNRTG